MTRLPRPAPVDQHEYAADAENPRRFYGLPADVRYCRRCVYSNQKPNSEREFEHTRATVKDTVTFDEEGICAACRVAEAKQRIDWEERERRLVELCNRYRRQDGRYDCLVPGSGGKDSFFAAHVLKYKYGMHPLTVTWAPHIYTEWGWRNFHAWIHAGLDNVLFTPNGRVHRLLTRLALERLLHPFQPFIMGQMYFPPRAAIQQELPLVFYGENPAEYGNPVATNATALKSWDYFSTADASQVYLAGTSVAELDEEFAVTRADLQPFMPPDPQRIAEAGVEVHYLGWYLRWHPQSNYYYAVEHGGFEAAPERSAGTYSKYSSIDDKIDDLHYFTTYIKFGIGRATYDASQEVRSGDITRQEALSLVRRYDGEYPTRFERENFAYLSLPVREFPIASQLFAQPMIDRDYFLALCDTFRSPHLWKQEAGRWQLRFPPYAESDV